MFGESHNFTVRIQKQCFWFHSLRRMIRCTGEEKCHPCFPHLHPFCPHLFLLQGSEDISTFPVRNHHAFRLNLFMKEIDPAMLT